MRYHLGQIIDPRTGCALKSYNNYKVVGSDSTQLQPNTSQPQPNGGTFSWENVTPPVRSRGSQRQSRGLNTQMTL